MKRLAIAIILFSVACLISIGGYFSLRSACEHLDGMITDSVACAQEENHEHLHICTERLDTAWKKYRIIFSMMTQHSHLDGFEQELHMMDYYAQNGDYDQYRTSAYEAQNELHHLLDSERITLGNIF